MIQEKTMNMIADGFEVSVKTEEDFFAVLQAQAENSKWYHEIPGQTLWVEALPSGPLFISEEEADKRNIDYDVLSDTSSNGGTCLVLHTDVGEMAIRACAIPSLYQTARISGVALGKVSREDLTQILNICLPAAALGNVLLLKRGGKVSAVLSDNTNGYQIMNSIDVHDIARNKLEQTFGTLVFKEGLVRHEYSYADYFLVDASDDILDEYEKIIQANPWSVRKAPKHVVVRVSNSDCGYSAAKVQPRFADEAGRSFAFVEGISVDHKRRAKEAPMELFENSINLLLAKIKESEETVRKMSNTELKYPHCVLENLLRAAKFPQKWITAANEDLSVFVPDGQRCTMLDVYYSMACIPMLAAAAKISATTVANYEERISRIALREDSWIAADINMYVANMRE